MKTIIYTLLIIIFVALQTTFFRYTANFLNCAPQVVLILVVSCAVLRGRVTGTVIGLVSGLIIDIISGHAIGLNALLLMHLGFLSAWFCKKFYNTSYKVVLIFVVLSNIIYSLLYYFFSFAIWGNGNFVAALWKVILPEIWWTMIIALPIFWIIEKIVKERG